MDPRMMRLFLFFCFVVFFFSGCSKDTDRKTKVQAGTASPANANRKLVPDPIAKDIAETSFILNEMSGIVSQVYKVLTQKEPGENSLNAFQVLRKNLMAEYNDNGQLKTELVKSKERKCSLRYSDKGGKREYSIYTAHADVCDQRASVQRLVRIGQEKPGTWYLAIDDQTLMSRQGLGRLAMSLADQGLQTHCRIEFSAGKKEISQFNCVNFSQDVKGSNEVRATQALLMSSLIYSRDQQSRTKVTGALYDLSQMPAKVKQTFQMREVPVDNKVLIDIKPEGQEVARPVDEMPVTDAPQAPATAGDPSAGTPSGSEAPAGSPATTAPASTHHETSAPVQDQPPATDAKDKPVSRDEISQEAPAGGTGPTAENTDPATQEPPPVER